MNLRKLTTRSTMLADRPIEWLTIRASREAVDALNRRRSTGDSLNDALENALGIIRKTRVKKLSIMFKTTPRKNRVKKVNP